MNKHVQLRIRKVLATGFFLRGRTKLFWFVTNTMQRQVDMALEPVSFASIFDDAP